jgi:hypothetical protein
MTRHFKAAVLHMSLAIPLLQVSVFAAQQAKLALPAPVPAQVLTAKRVFVANAGGDEPSFGDPLFSGEPDRAYNQFYAVMKTWGWYELVAAPADADLLFEIRFSAPALAGAAAHGDALFGTPYDPQFRLVIRDPKTNVLLWGITEHAQWAVLQGNRDKNFDLALARTVSDVQRLSPPPAASANSANKQ